MLIGTSGYVYSSWAGEFYPPDLPKSKWFDYYAQKFNSLELNSTFYRIPKISTIKSWKYKLRKHNMKISIKANKSITHTHKLTDLDILREFLELIEYFEETLYCVLFQLPPSLKKNIELLNNFISVLKEYDFKHSIEFRHSSWYDSEIYEILKKANIALVWHDYNQEMIKIKTADFIYVRFHGYSGKYKGSYPENTLKEFCSYEKGAIYFNNTDDVSAPYDAIRLKTLCSDKK
jgi:uncharacterized protein YecE (DUF72 family)